MVDQATRSCTQQKITGTREWATHNVNIQLGCEHRCRYCYARQMARQHGRIQSLDEWGTSYLRLGVTNNPQVT